MIPRHQRNWKESSELSSEEARKGRQILADCLNGEDPTPWLPRLVLGSDGTYGLMVHRPLLSDKELAETRRTYEPSRSTLLESQDAPMVPIGAALALLRSPESPELVIERRRQAEADAEERTLREQEAADKKRAQQEAEIKAQARRREDEFHGSAWDALPGWARLVFRLALVEERYGEQLALAHEQHGLTELAVEIRGVAQQRVEELRAIAPSIMDGGRWHKSTRRLLESDPLNALLHGPSFVFERWWGTGR